ncbi:cylicin-1-like [Vespa mandarinia]|uniref:cylicin-1-like n=1 Tax=Vespa mandarinia TaxID=7446 RepID=UPI00161F3AD0|nr:cylicin-1-like [Vespa mandarinia]
MIDLRIYFLMALSVSCAISFNQRYEYSMDTNLNYELDNNPWYDVNIDPMNSESSDSIYVKKIPREDKNVKKILSPPFKTEKDNTRYKIIDPGFSTLENHDGSKMAAAATTSTTATAAASEQHVNDRIDPFEKNKNPYRFGEEIFTADETNIEMSKKYKKENENCEKIIRDSMICMVCKDIKSKAKYEQCSYVSKPNEKSYAYTKSKSFGKNRNENDKNNNNDDNDDNNGGGRLAENTKRKKDEEEKKEEVEEEEEKTSSSSDCKKIEKDGKTCTICKDPKNGDNYEKCSYAYQPMDKIYKFSRSKSFGYPENLSGDIKKDVGTIEDYPKESRYTDYSKDYTLPYDQIKKTNYDEKSIPSVKIDNESSYDSYIPDHYKSPSEYKSESEKNSEKIDRTNCKVIEKDSMTCKVCKDPKNGDNFEQCSYSYKPKDKVYAYTKGESFGSPTKSDNDDDERKESTNIYDVQEKVKETKDDKKYDDIKNTPLDSSENTKSSIYVPTSDLSDKTSSDVKGEKLINNKDDRYFEDSKRKKEEIEKFMKDFQKEDRSNCKKVIKDNMTCYRCKDDKDIHKEECIFVGDEDVKKNNKDRLTYREVKQFKFDPDIKSSGSSLSKRNSNDKIIVDTDILEPIASASEDSYARTMTSDDAEKTTEEETLHEVEPYEYVAETRPIYDKNLGLTLPAFMLTKSEHEQEFDDVVASSRI